jgi:AAA+ superfamily predicted ATPase
MSFLNEFILLLKARYPIIYISTGEEERVEYLIKHCAKKYVLRNCYSWDFIEGYYGNPNDVGFSSRNPLKALDLIENFTPETPSLFILKDYDNFFKDFSVIRKLKNLSRRVKAQPKNIIIVSAEVNLPESLKESITFLEFPLPSYYEIFIELRRLIFSVQQKIETDTLENIAVACKGLSLEKIRRVLSKIIIKYGELSDLSSIIVIQEKKQIIQQTELLEFCTKDKNLSDLGGLDIFKHWVRVRGKAFSQEARTYGLPYPKGLLLIGVQGTGKTIAAKIIAQEWKLPLLRLDFGTLFASLVGQSEQRIRKMIELAEAISPCVLWVDEIDKALGGQHSTDNATTCRVLSTFITWLSEKESPVFIVATANKILWIPPEMLRKGRFDEIFFLDLPTQDERASIFFVHLKKYRPSFFRDYPLTLLSTLSKGLSGAEIEQVIIEAMRLGFNENRELTIEDLFGTIQTIVPLIRVKNNEVELLKVWAQSKNVVNASK